MWLVKYFQVYSTVLYVVYQGSNKPYNKEFFKAVCWKTCWFHEFLTVEALTLQRQDSEVERVHHNWFLPEMLSWNSVLLNALSMKNASLNQTYLMICRSQLDWSWDTLSNIVIYVNCVMLLKHLEGSQWSKGANHVTVTSCFTM